MFHYVGLIITGIYFMADSMEMSLLLFLAVTIKGEWELLAGESATHYGGHGLGASDGWRAV